MENDKELTYGNIIGALAACGLVGWLMYDVFKTAPIASIVIWVIMIGVVAAIIIRNRMVKSTDALERDICKQLDRQGFRHEKHDGTLYVTKNDQHFRIHLANSFDKRIKHLYFIYEFGDDNFEKVSKEGWTRAANSINVNNTITTFVALEDHFCCCYQTAIGNAKNFMNEFDRAYWAIGEVLDDYNKIYPYIERDYPNSVSENKNSIGFK